MLHLCQTRVIAHAPPALNAERGLACVQTTPTASLATPAEETSSDKPIPKLNASSRKLPQIAEPLSAQPTSDKQNSDADAQTPSATTATTAATAATVSTATEQAVPAEPANQVAAAAAAAAV